MLGLAREVAAMTGKPLRTPNKTAPAAVPGGEDAAESEMLRSEYDRLA
jgi:hypothetical protein